MDTIHVFAIADLCDGGPTPMESRGVNSGEGWVGRRVSPLIRFWGGWRQWVTSLPDFSHNDEKSASSYSQ